MKRKTQTLISLSFVFCLLLLGVSQADAQQKKMTSEEIAKKIAPFVNETTVVVGYLNFEEIDLYQIAGLSEKYLEEIMKLIKFDEKSFESTRNEWKKVLELKKEEIEAPLKKLRDETGLKDVYFTVNLADPVFPAVIIIPVKGIKKEQKERINEYLSETLNSTAVYATSDFMFAGAASNAYMFDEDQDYSNLFKKRISEFKSAPVPLIKDAFALREGDPLRIVAVVPKDATKLIRNLSVQVEDESAKIPLNLAAYASTKLLWGVYGIDPTKPECQLILKARNRSAALDIMRTLEGSLGYLSMATQFIAAMAGEAEDERVKDAMPLSMEILKAYARSHFPKQDDDLLVWEVDMSPENLKKMSYLHGAPAGVIIALALPAVQAAREAARRMQCLNNEKQIVFAFHIYHDAHQSFPPIFTADKDGKVLHSWRVLILPYLEHQELYEKIRLDEPWDSPHNKQFHDQCPTVYRCPSASVESESKTCCYSVIMGEETAFFDETPRSMGSISDGTSNTVAIVERKDPINWMDPLNEITFEEALEGINTPKSKIGSRHTGGINIALFDASVQFISSTVDKDVWKAILTIAGGEAIAVP